MQDLIAGNWISTKGSSTAKVTMFENRDFSGALFVEDKIVWVFRGTWSLNNNTLRWDYSESIPPLESMNAVNPDENIVMAADNAELVLIEKSGETTTYKKANSASDYGEYAFKTYSLKHSIQTRQSYKDELDGFAIATIIAFGFLFVCFVVFAVSFVLQGLSFSDSISVVVRLLETYIGMGVGAVVSTVVFWGMISGLSGKD